MKLIRGYFDAYNHIGDSNILIESYSRTRYFSSGTICSASGITVFISHKHSDLNDLKGLLTFLKRDYNVVPYLDTMDNRMPNETCGDTAVRIKDVINTCNRFLFLATNKALASKWCNWEVGIADKLKLPTNNMAILPMVETLTSMYDGNEYLEIYPYVDEIKDYYGQTHLTVVYRSYDGKQKRVSLKEWLSGSENY